MFFVAKELIGLPGMPATTKGVRQALDKATEGTDLRRVRAGSKAFEYHVDCLPLQARDIARSYYLDRALEAHASTEIEPIEPVKSTEVKKSGSEKLNDELSLIRQCPALLDRKVGELTGNQKDIADSRAILAQEVLKLIRLGSSRTAAVKMISEQSRDLALPQHLQRAADDANARKGKTRTGVSVRSLQEWVTIYQSTANGGERLALLAPGHHKARKAEHIGWLPAFLVYWRNPIGLNMKECYRRLCLDWAETFADQPAMLNAMPSYDAVRRALDKLPKRELMRGRVTGSAATSLEPYQKRDWSQIPVNGCWISDGKSMNMKFAHPIHGRPFIPEITLVMDGRTRFVVGWSLSHSENAIGVAEAYAHGIGRYGKPLFVYSDNGGGQKNKMLDEKVLGIFSRMGIEHLTGIPGHPQARGIIERLNGVIPLRIAQRFATYNGAHADREMVRVLDRNINSAVNAQKQNKPLDARQSNALAKLPSWGQLMDAIQEEVDKYNNSHEHSELPKFNGKYLTPAQYRAALLEIEGDDIEYLSEIELRELFKPQYIRTCARGWIEHNNNEYFAEELGDFDGQKVRIGIDIHNANYINIYRMDGSWICKGIWNGNKRAAIPINLVEKQQKDRAKRQLKNFENKIDAIKQESRHVIEHKPDFSGFLPSEAATSDDKPFAFLQSDLTRNNKKVINE